MSKIKLNMIVAFFSKILFIITGIISQRYVLVSYGAEINGLTSAATQFLTYFTLLEAGLGLASVQALYRPISRGDTAKISQILSATAIQYKRVGVLFFILTFILAAIMPFMTTSNIENKTVFILVILMGMASVLNYFFIGRYQVLLTADQKVYFLNSLDSFLGLAFRIINIIMINNGYSVISVYSVGLLSPIIRIIVLKTYFCKHYQGISNTAKPDFEATKKRKFVLIHQIVGMITTQTDVALLTVVSTLSNVSMYSVYNLIYSNIQMILTATFYTAVEPTFGILVGKESSKLKIYHSYYETFLTFLLSIVLSSVLIMTIPFIKLYTKGIEDINYVDPILAVLFMIACYCSMIRFPAIILVNTTGAFKETQRGAIVEAILNISVSLIMFKLIGIRGLLVGTCMSIIYRLIDIQIYVYKNILKTKLSKWIRLALINMLSIILFVIFFTVIRPINVESWLLLICTGFKVIFISSVYFTVIFTIFYFNEVRNILSNIRVRYRGDK